MSKFNTLKRVVFSLGLVLAVAQSAAAQSVLNFSRAVSNGARNTGVAITNPNAYYADVQLTLFGLDGIPVANGLVNPVNYRIAPRGQLSMTTNELFAAGRVDGWIQATSSSSELSGFSFTGGVSSIVEAAEAVLPFASQVLPLFREQGDTHTDVVLINPANARASVNVIFYNDRGLEIGTEVRSLAPRELYRFRPAPRIPIGGLAGVSARVTSSIPVVASAIVAGQTSVMSINGQPDQNVGRRIAPHFLSGNGSDSIIVLANPNPDAADVSVTLYQGGGIALPPIAVTIPARGVVSLSSRDLTAQLPVGPIDGWLQIDSAAIALDGVVILSSGADSIAIPLQRAAPNRMLFSQLLATSTVDTRLAVVNSGGDSTVTVAVTGIDGLVVGQRDIPLKGGSKLYSAVRDLLPEAVGQNGGIVSIRSTSGVYGVEVLESPSGAPLASLGPQHSNLDYAPNGSPDIPRILRVDPGTTVVAGTGIRITVSEISNDTQVFLGGQSLSFRFIAPGVAIIQADVPASEPGFASLRVRVRGAESAPFPMQILPASGQPLITVYGQAFYQKLDVGDTGLDLNHPSMVPIRNARVEIVDSIAGSVISVTDTDGVGRFRAAVPPQSEVIVRVLSRLRSSELRVLDNTSNDVLYTIQAPFDPRENSGVLIADTTRKSGAFNILEMIQRGNDLIRIADLRILPPAPAIFWSVRNTLAAGDRRAGQVGTTFFSLNANTAYVLGDRNVDSDEYDDSVIIHEYAHMLAARFSRDDSPGSLHGIGDMLDPRLAWSEGWANFFSGAARNEALYRDSRGVNGVNVLRIDLEDNVPPTDQPGYWSEASVQSLLWDLFDDRVDAGDFVQYSFTTIWGAVTDLKSDHFVYLPYFLDHFINREASSADALRTMAQLRSIDFQPSGQPSVTDPFPKPISSGDVDTGWVDSLTPKRINLARSSHFYTFVSTGDAVSIRLDITALGPGNNAAANDLDLFLMDANGRLIDSSDRGLNGQSELITRRLAAGTYVVEIRSYYTRAETNVTVWNSGFYRLSLLAQ